MCLAFQFRVAMFIFSIFSLKQYRKVQGTRTHSIPEDPNRLPQICLSSLHLKKKNLEEITFPSRTLLFHQKSIALRLPTGPARFLYTLRDFPNEIFSPPES